MKKLGEGRRRWLARRQRKLHQARRRASRRSDRPRAWTTVVVKLPRELVAEHAEHRQKIATALGQMGAALATDQTRVRLDFSGVQKMFPGGTLLLLAALELYTERFPKRVKASCPPGSLAAQLLRHFGLGDRLGVPARGNGPRNHNVVNWEYLTDVWADGAKVSSLLDKYRTLIHAKLPEDLYAVLTEGITNVRHWAYPVSCEVPESLRRWWMFSRYVPPSATRDGNLYIAIYDIGVGIPASLSGKLTRKEVVYDSIDRFTGTKLLDRELLAQAVEHTRSGTGEGHRGKGLPEMKSFIEETKVGRLYIVSGNAHYLCLPERSYSKAASTSNPFPGTLILWSLPLKAMDENHGE